MTDKLILVLNCGSSSLKGAVLNNDNGDVLMTCLAEKMGLPDAFVEHGSVAELRQLVGLDPESIRKEIEV